jgi:hypothetical protein
VTASERLSHARDTLDALFPGADIQIGATAHTAAPRERQFGLLPAPSHPRLLVPMQPAGAGRAALRAYGGRLSTRARLGYRSLTAGLALTGKRYPRPWASVAGPSGTAIDDHLATIVGRPVSVAIHLTPPRANRKPIVQALTAGERFPVAFAKLATNPLTARLVTAEAKALVQLADHSWSRVVVPRVLNRQDFNGWPALVLEPLPVWAPGRPAKAAEVRAAAAEIAACAAPTTSSLADSAYWQQLQAQVEQVASAEHRAALQRTGAEITQTAGNTAIAFGAAHGDFTPWNMWWTRSGLLIWDWERFSMAVPIGADMEHYRLQEMLLIDKVDHATAAQRLVADSSTPLVAALHLFALAVRYDADDQAAAGSRLPPTSQWLLPAVTGALHEEIPAGRCRA